LSRLLDITGAVLLLTLVAPFVLLAAILILLDSRGPVLFRQERVGWRMRPFRILKLRTMTATAAPDGAPEFEFAHLRVTRVGRWLRHWKVDELPQLWNILVGEMSFVGPRPEVPTFVEQFREEYEVLLLRRPGLTDPAAIAYRHEAEQLAREQDPEAAYVTKILPNKLRLSREYATRRTLRSDLVVLAMTLWALRD
jgi:lipopolysaccharide/colanic/teichoic acid biosynthesis glycosyltransferase